MGDRTSVELTVLRTQAKKAEALFGGWSANETFENDPLLIGYYFEEVNYGNLDFLDDLRDNGIAYDSEWGDGGEYSAGTQSLRFTETGELQFKSVYDAAINPDLCTLMELLDDPVMLVQHIKDHHAGLQVLPWDNQEEYGKRYLAMKLTDPNQASPTPL